MAHSTGWLGGGDGVGSIADTFVRNANGRCSVYTRGANPRSSRQQRVRNMFASAQQAIEVTGPTLTGTLIDLDPDHRRWNAFTLSRFIGLYCDHFEDAETDWGEMSGDEHVPWEIDAQSIGIPDVRVPDADVTITPGLTLWVYARMLWNLGVLEPPFPQTPLLDDFNRPDEGPPMNANWLGSSYLCVRSNAAHASLEPYPGYGVWATQAPGDCEVWGTVAVTSINELRVTARGKSTQSTTNSYQVGLVGYSYDPAILVIAPPHRIILEEPMPAPMAVGDGWGMRMSGSTIKIFHRTSAGGEWSKIFTVEDSADLTGGYIGVMVHGAGALDDFGGGYCAPAPFPSPAEWIEAIAA